MTTPKQTIRVEEVLDTMNKAIKYSKSAEGRADLCSAVETMLFATGQYGGFRCSDLFQEPQLVKDDDPRNMTRYQEFNREYFLKKTGK